MANSINTNIAAFFAQANISTAANASSSSVARLSSGNRIVKASDDVAALSTGTSLRTQVLALKTALTNASQGTSLLQVADGALSQVTEILQRQKAISLQAGSGSLTDADRGFLDQEFQALTKEIDRLTGSTNFNGVQLLNGSLSTSAALANTSTGATAGTANISFSDNITIGESIIVNGVELTAAATSTGTATPASTAPITFAVGNTLAETLDNLATQLNDSATNASYSAALGEAVYSANSTTLTATARAGGSLSNAFSFGNAAPAVTVGANTVSTTNGSASVTVAITNTYKVGQSVILNLPTSAGIGGIEGKELRGVITSASGSTFTFTAQTAATSTVATTNGAGTVTLDTVNGVGEAAIDGGSVGSSFNLFTGATTFTSATQIISAATSTAAIPFQDGNSITATVNGTAKTLYTLAASATITDLVNGINANTGSTGFSATLTYDQTNNYNVRIDYAGAAGNILLNVGANFHTAPTAVTLTGDRFGTTANNITEAAGGTSTIISSGYIDLTGAAGSTGITVADQTTDVTAAAPASAAAPFRRGDQITATVNGQTIVLHTFVAGDSLNAIVNDINAHSSSTGFYAGITGTGGGYNIRLFTTTPTPASDQVYVSAGAGISTIASSTLTTLTTTNGGLTQVSTGSLAGGLDDGLSQGSVSVSGTVGDSIITDLSQTKANVQLILTANAVAGTSTLTVGGHTFAFTSNTTNASPDEILVGATIEDTLNNAITTITNYLKNGYALGTTAYELNQIDISVTNGNTLNFTGKGLSNVETLASTSAVPAYSTISQSITGSSITNSGALNNAASTYGVDTTGITNPDFNGTLQGFTANYKNTASTVDLSIKVGDFTYTAVDANVSVSSNTRIRLYSDTVGGENGGYIDIQLKAGQVNAFSDQAGADAVAQRLNSAFSSLSFAQSRNLSSYTGSASITSNNVVIGSLFGSKVTAQLANFDGAKLSDISVDAPSGSNTDTKISLTIDGVVFSTEAGIGSTLAANQTYRLTSAEDPKQFVEFTTGNSTIVIDSNDKAIAVENALKNAFGATEGSAALSFQVGSSSTDTLEVSIGSAQTSTLFGGLTLNVLSQANAVIAGDQLDKALATVTSLRAAVGALQSRFNFASANIQIAVQNQDAARGELLDTDVATESTAFATSQVKLQAGISVLAQANQQLQNLLKLIQ
ncbi:MAG: flagellin [Rickettsiales bacterium]